MAAVSLAENTERKLTAANISSIERSYGPFQINLNAHPQYTIAQVTTLDSAAKAAKEIYDRASGFSPWTMFINGGYQAFIPAVDISIPSYYSNILRHNIGGGVSSGLGLPNLNPITGVTGAIGDALKPFITLITLPVTLLVKILTFLTTEKHWWQIGFILAGLGMVGLGTAIFFRNDVEAAVKVAAKAAV